MSGCGSSGAAVPEILLGFGGNLGDPAATITAALARFDAAGLRILRRSSFYRTAPWGLTDQPDFVNLCALAETALSPRALMALIFVLQLFLIRMAWQRRRAAGKETA